MRGSREEKRISENFEQVQKELRTSSKGAENKFKTCGEQVHFFWREKLTWSHEDTEYVRGLFWILRRGNIPPTENAEFVGDCR